MTVPSDVIRVAARQIGYVETSNNRTKFGVWYGMDGQPWCAIFVSYCFYMAGLPLPITTSKGFAYCPYGVDWFKSKGQWFKNPKVGDVVFYDWYPGTVDSDAWHVGIVESINPDGSVVSIEGNTAVGNDSNGGKVMRRTRGTNVQYGFGRPAYSGVPYFSTNSPIFPRWPGRYVTLASPATEGNDVLTWQQQMIIRGWNLGSGGSTGKGDTGIFDQRCFEVLKQFQRNHNLEVDGILGPVSWDAAWELPVT
ncbi:MAG: CHAP domain-containing protein [Synechococcales cyanobacterium C42_A2020_086]|nr:CHAP domain-containing protein [Synechococcales cyanobacterium C42_A2020_086]